ncbi:MAG: hypoxanthine phosphoribosyltransferase [Candidatus Eisenbacteria sp.]|nr:hypoxanthine phosphoribosyltransferase [Candidatus Eisenbacteria bacterium]
MIEAVRNLKQGDQLRLSDGDGKVLFGAEEIAVRVAELGREITAAYQGTVPVLVAILRGGFIFQCDLAHSIEVAQEFDFLAVSRFNPQERGRTAVKVLHDLRSDIRGRDVLVVEGIRTDSTKIEYVQTFLQLREPATLRFAALVCHECARNHSVPLQYKGFDIGNEFVVGCGLDYRERYRNLPIIATFSPTGGGAAAVSKKTANADATAEG